MDYYNKNIEIECGLRETQVSYLGRGEVTKVTDAFMVDSYCKLRTAIKGNTHKKDSSKLLLLILNTSDGEGKILAKKIQHNTDKMFIFKGIFKRADNIFFLYPTLVIIDVQIIGKAPATEFSDLFR